EKIRRIFGGRGVAKLLEKMTACLPSLCLKLPYAILSYLSPASGREEDKEI
ncbi:hypothetical protein AM202_04352, partial [Actinobacillus minor 202]